MPILQLCAILLIPNCLRSNFSYSPLVASELYVKAYKATITQLNKYITIHNVKAKYSDKELNEIYAKAKDIMNTENKISKYQKMKEENEKLRDIVSELIYRLNAEKRQWNADTTCNSPYNIPNTF